MLGLSALRLPNAIWSNKHSILKFALQIRASSQAWLTRHGITWCILLWSFRFRFKKRSRTCTSNLFKTVSLNRTAPKSINIWRLSSILDLETSTPLTWPRNKSCKLCKIGLNAMEMLKHLLNPRQKIIQVEFLISQAKKDGSLVKAHQIGRVKKVD